MPNHSFFATNTRSAIVVVATTALLDPPQRLGHEANMTSMASCPIEHQYTSPPARLGHTIALKRRDQPSWSINLFQTHRYKFNQEPPRRKAIVPRTPTTFSPPTSHPHPIINVRDATPLPLEILNMSKGSEPERILTSST